MSAVVAAFQPVFVTETGARSASAGGAFLTETTVNYVGLAGSLAPSLTFTAGLTVVAGSAVTQQLVTSFTAGPYRGDFTGAVGEAFTPAIPMTFDKIGLRCGSGVLGSQQVAIGKDDGSNWLATVTIDLTGHSLGEWVYVDIPPITLNAGTNYCLWSEVTAGNGYNWSDADVPNAVTLRDCSSSTSAYGFSIHDVLHYGIGPGTMYVGVDLAVGVTAGATVDLAGNLSPSATLAADLALTRDLAGDLAPSLTFAAALSVTSISYVDLAGGLTLALALAADLTVAIDTAHYVDFTGNLGGISSYGRLKYGRGHYSRIDAFAPAFSAALDIVGQDFFDGNLAPVITFAGALSVTVGLGAGDLAPIVTFTGDLTLVPYVDFAGNLTPLVTLGGDLTLNLVLDGDLAPQVALGASLSLDLPLAAIDGSFGFTVVLGALELISGPLWASTEPCPTPSWTPTDPCPPSLWTPIDPCDPVEWEETELCNG